MERTADGGAGGRPEPRHKPEPKHKQDARPMRLALGVGGLATLSAIATAIVTPVGAMPVAPAAQAADTAGTAPTSVAVHQPVVYVTLAPGQTAPPGAKTIAATAPKPVTIVTTVAAPAQRRIVVKTTQSGKVVP